MLIDKKSFFNVNIKDVEVVPPVVIKALENDLGTILAQAPADDKMELLLKYHNKTHDGGAAVQRAVDEHREHEARKANGNDVSLVDALGQVIDGINTLSDKIDNIGKKGPKK